MRRQVEAMGDDRPSHLGSAGPKRPVEIQPARQTTTAVWAALLLSAWVVAMAATMKMDLDFLAWLRQMTSLIGAVLHPTNHGWRTIAIVLALANLKALPFFWHVRLRC